MKLMRQHDVHLIRRVARERLDETFGSDQHISWQVPQDAEIQDSLSKEWFWVQAWVRVPREANAGSNPAAND